MTTFKALYWDSEGGDNAIADVVEYEGRLWLVGKWHHNTKEGGIRPIRLVRPLKPGAWQKGAPPHANYFLMGPIPKSIFDEGARVPEDKFEVVDRPAIRIESGGVK